MQHGQQMAAWDRRHWAGSAMNVEAQPVSMALAENPTVAAVIVEADDEVGAIRQIRLWHAAAQALSVLARETGHRGCTERCRCSTEVREAKAGLVALLNSISPFSA